MNPLESDLIGVSLGQLHAAGCAESIYGKQT
jgi:hypothetical protein